MFKRLFYLSIFALALFLVFGAGSEDRPMFQMSRFSIVPAEGAPIPFEAEVALSPSEQAYGLMFARSMPEGRGMIFPFTPPSQATFWMKNTYIPLDIIFVAPGGSISHITENAKPHDLTPIQSPGKVAAVIELIGGTAKKHKIQVGDKVESPVIKPQ
jgi:uncharacterized membrane protein (UPF0127 family)